MKAAVRTHYCPPAGLRIENLPKPTPQNGELLVRVHAATVNRTDMAVLTGFPLIMRLFTGLSKPTLPVTGTDFAGVVEAVGDGVQTFKPGDRVFGFYDQGLGSHAEYVAVSEKKAVGIIPEGIGFVDAAASLEAFHYAFNFLKSVPLAPGQSVMVNGGTGAIGSVLVQMLVERGVDVVATSRPEHAETVLGLGARAVLDYTKTDFTQGEERFDAVFDAVGKSTFGRCKRLLKAGGVYVSSELGPGWQNTYLPLITSLTRGKRVFFPIPTDIPASIRQAQMMLEKRTFRPLIDRTYPLDAIREAFEYVAAGQKVGNVVLTL